VRPKVTFPVIRLVHPGDAIAIGDGPQLVAHLTVAEISAISARSAGIGAAADTGSPMGDSPMTLSGSALRDDFNHRLWVL